MESGRGGWWVTSMGSELVDRVAPNDKILFRTGRVKR